ncbi:MAG: DNA recombination protein RmuC [Dongiales bacterium]
MDSIPLLLALLLGVVAAALVMLLLFRRRGGEAAALAQIAGRLDQLAQSHAAQQAALDARLQSQERNLAKTVEDRLSDLNKRVGDKLQESSEKAGESLTQLAARLAVIDRAQANIMELSGQVVGLQNILSNKQARGAFGEVQLNDLVRDLLAPESYEFQAKVGNGKADCLLKLPHPPGPIAIDAKFPLESYRALRSAANETERIVAGRAFDQALRKHVKDIREKYIVAGETAESALLFLPSEAVYAELYANFPNVVEESYRARVWIVSPTTMMALLNTVRAVLRDVEMRKEAGQIKIEVDRMLEDVVRLNERVGKLGTHFEQARGDVEKIRISTEGIVRHGERIRAVELGEDKVELTPVLPHAVAKASGE